MKIYIRFNKIIILFAWLFSFIGFAQVSTITQNSSPSIDSTFWTPINGPHDVISLTISSSGVIFAGTVSSGIYISTDDGVNWIQKNLPVYVNSVVINSFGYIFAGTGGGIYLSTDDGANWELSLDIRGSINKLAINSSGYIFAGTAYGVYLSTNNGETWTRVDTWVGNTIIRSLTINSSNNIFVGSVRYGDHGTPLNILYLSTDNGTSWSQTSFTTDFLVQSLAINSSGYIFAGTDRGGIFLSTDNGISWTSINNGLTESTLYLQKYVFSLAINSSGYIFAGVTYDPAIEASGVYLSKDNGANWTQTGNIVVSSLAINPSDYIFAGTLNEIIRSKGSTLASVQSEDAQLPNYYNLYQNYPNPFNPSTTFSFSLASKSFVSLKVFDIMGKEVETIISEEMSSGNYSRQWSVSGLSSGVYFYRLQAGLFSQTKKLILLK